MATSLVGALSACSLLTSLDGLSGAEPQRDGGPIVSDGGADTSATGDGAAVVDSAGPDGSDPRFVAYGNAVLADAPIAYWRFEETVLPTAKDERGLHDAVYVSSPTLGEPGIAGGHAVRLPSGKFANVTQGDLVFRFAGRAPYTVELWVKLSTLKNFQWLAGTEADTTPRSGWSMWSNGTGGTGYEVWGAPLVDGGTTMRRGSYVSDGLVIGRFQHFVMTYDGTVASSWVDGVQGARASNVIEAPDTGTLMLGCRRAIGTPYACVAEGFLDEVAIYDRPLPEARIVAHYELGKP